MAQTKRALEDLMYRLNMAFDLNFSFQEDDGDMVVFCDTYPAMKYVITNLEKDQDVFEFFKNYFDKRYKDAGL